MLRSLMAMTARTSKRVVSATIPSTSPNSSTTESSILTPSGSSSIATTIDEHGSSTSSTRTKRARYVPPPLETTEKSISVKIEQDSETYTHFSPDESTQQLTPIRYSLRRKVKAEPQEIKPLFSMEQSEEGLSEDGEPNTPKKKRAASTNKVRKEPLDPFAVSPRKTQAKPIKLDLEAHEARPAPKRWKEQYEILIKQRKRIIAPVDTLGCEENGRDEKRKDKRETMESPEETAKRARFTTLVSLMLSSQTKDPVTAEAVHNLQRNLPNGLCLDSILNASQDQISININKVGFWRRKTGYIQSAAKILRDDFDGDVPKTIDELCSLPGVGPKMGFLALQSAWNINVGIGVDVHVHRVSNRLKWVKSTDPEGTRLQLQSWLPKELHRSINKTLVGFGQVICQPVGPRCDLCALGAAKLCPSYRRVDPKSIASRVKIELLPEESDQMNGDITATAAVKVEGPEGAGTILVKQEDEHLDW